jgi:hypothetical protein
MDGTFVPLDVPGDIKLAIQCVTKVFEQALASGRHQPGDWRQLTLDQIFNKLWNHLDEDIFQVYGPWNDKPQWDKPIPAHLEDDLANGACRILMLLQLREEARNALPSLSK